MPEATIICCDCSEWMRNGDFQPSRFDAQKGAINVVCGAKTEQNRENEVGLLQMGGKGKATVLINCTTEVGHIHRASHAMSIKGKADLLVTLQTAQLALKHRKNKKQTQRIVVFIGSPVENKKNELVKAAKRLKKNKVAVDIIAFGENDDNQEILNVFIEKVNSNGNSNLVAVPYGSNLADAVVTSPICIGEGGAVPANDGGAPNAGGQDFLGGIDPQMDPDLAMALRISLEEERARQQVLAGGEEEKKEGDGAGGDSAAPVAPNANDNAAPISNAPASGASGGMDVDDEDDDDDDEALARAIAMSMAAENVENKADDQPSTKKDDPENPEFIEELLDELPGMDKDDIPLDELLGMVEDGDEDEKKEGEGGGDKKKKDGN